MVAFHFAGEVDVPETEAGRIVRDAYWSLLADRTEERAIARLLRKAGANRSWRVLDVGCGCGRNLRALRDAGFSPSGVDVNPGIAEAVRRAGFPCHGPDDPALDAAPWDALLMSHLIEHLDSGRLLKTMNDYLARLRAGGLLVIASPLPTVRFWDNFDHVKPYTPAAIEEVFGLRGRQVQYQSSAELTVERIWFRRRPFSARYRTALLRREPSVAKAAWGAVNIVSALAHRLSLGLVGVTDGWVGIYRKGGRAPVSREGRA